MQRLEEILNETCQIDELRNSGVIFRNYGDAKTIKQHRVIIFSQGGLRFLQRQSVFVQLAGDLNLRKTEFFTNGLN
jgi:hypothetical protein